LTPEARAAKLGFMKYLPQDTEIVMSFQNGAKSVDRVKSSKIWKMIESEMGMGIGLDPMEGAAPPAGNEKSALPEGGADGTFNQPGTVDPSAPMLISTEAPEGAAKEPAAAGGAGGGAATGALLGAAVEGGAAEVNVEPAGPAALFGTEFTIALGKTTAEQTPNLAKMYSRMGYFQMRTLAKAFAAAAKSGDLSALKDAMDEQYGKQLVKDLIADPESGITLLERMKMPPLYLAFRTSDKERAGAAQQISALTANLAFLGEITEPVSVEKAGGKFEGLKISGAKIAASMKEDRASMDEALGAPTADKLLAALEKNNLVVASGTVGEYVVLFVGSSTDDLALTENPGQSLAASDALAFCDTYASKDLAAVIYGQKNSLDKMTACTAGLSDMVAGVRDGISGAEGLGDTRDLETLLRMVVDRQAALKKLSSNETLGMVAFFEEGLKVECFGGTDTGAIDWKSPNKLASLGNSEDLAMFLNVTSDAAYDKAMGELAETLVETAYAAGKKVAELPIENGDIAQFKQMFKLFDSDFRTDTLALWDAFHGDFSGSIGKERALILDLNGSVPTIPGVPKAIIDGGKFPRITMITPVTDRAKLAGSWDKMNTTTTGILAKISKMVGQEIPMQKPMSSEKNNCVTWFFTLPFMNDDFVPSVTVGDKWFAASTSKNQALDLIAKAEKGGETRTGVYFSMNFKTLQKFSKETFKLMEKNAENLLGADAPSADDNKKIGEAIDAMDDIDKLTVHARREGGAMRTSIHFKTR
ncbi:MAG: hypothetical protein WCS43_17045, partial [Verrucomicrobiota bacterium]